MVELIQVEGDDVRLDRLLQLYMAEWSALVATPIGADARYCYADLPAYADQERHAAYLVIAGELPVGFALAACDDAGAWHIEEFFVIPARVAVVGAATPHDGCSRRGQGRGPGPSAPRTRLRSRSGAAWFLAPTWRSKSAPTASPVPGLRSW